MATYGKNTAFEEVPDDEEESGGGNTGLPFGLCKKYGIAIEKNWTPRDAWNALKGQGVYPPWTEKGKDQYPTGEISNEGDDAENNSNLKSATEKIRSALEKGKFSAEYRSRVERALESFSDDELQTFAAALDGVNFNKGSGKFGWGLITVPEEGTTDLDSELGFEFRATTFFHEYGHALAWLMGKKEGFSDFNQTPEMQAIFAEDAKALLDKCLNAAGLSEKANLSRISRNATQAFYKELRKVSKKTIADLTPPSAWEDGHVMTKEEMAYEKQQLIARNWSEEEAESLVKQRQEVNIKRHEEFVKKQKFYEDNKDKIPAAKVSCQRMGFLSDFIAGATSGRINPYKEGYWGHSDSYWKGKKLYGVSFPGTQNGIEPWAEFCSFKMTKDNKGLELFKQYLPKTYTKYEEVYSKIKEKI